MLVLFFLPAAALESELMQCFRGTSMLVVGSVRGWFHVPLYPHPPLSTSLLRAFPFRFPEEVKKHWPPLLLHDTPP